MVDLQTEEADRGRWSPTVDKQAKYTGLHPAGGKLL